MLLRILTTWPLPTGPQCETSLPMQRSSGRTRPKASASPPTMMLSVPFSAAARVRAIGASR
jgi:hypothetical protein